MLNSSGKSGQTFHISDLGEKTFNLLPLSTMLVMGTTISSTQESHLGFLEQMQFVPRTISTRHKGVHLLVKENFSDIISSASWAGPKYTGVFYL